MGGGEQKRMRQEDTDRGNKKEEEERPGTETKTRQRSSLEIIQEAHSRAADTMKAWVNFRHEQDARASILHDACKLLDTGKTAAQETQVGREIVINISGQDRQWKRNRLRAQEFLVSTLDRSADCVRIDSTYRGII